jgi:hypothetical protein
MCGIKFWKWNKNPRPVHKKLFFLKFSGFAFLTLKFSKSIHCLSFLRDENFFSLNMANVVSKNPSLKQISKNVNFSKKATKKSFSQSPWKTVKTFFRCTFYKGQMYIFEICRKRRIFYAPFKLFKEKSFHLTGESMCTFYELKSPKCKQPVNISSNGFFINPQVLDFLIACPKFYARHLGLKITDLYYTQSSPVLHPSLVTHRTPSDYTFLYIHSKTWWFLREELMIYRGSGYLAVVWFGSKPAPFPLPFPSVNCLSFSVFLCVFGRAYWRERGEGVGLEPRKPGPL